MKRRRTLGWLVCATSFFLVLSALVSTHPAFARPDTPSSTDTSASIRVDASPIRKFARFSDGPATSDLGKVTFRGGLVLSSPSPDFGGWSGLLLDDDATSLFAISDVGTWFSGKIVYEGTAPSAITDARLGPLQSKDGALSGRKRDSDSESVALESGTIANGTILVAFERRHRIARYSVSSSGVVTRGGGLPLPASARKMRANQGIEALTVLKGGPYKGAPIAFSERLYDAARNHTGWLWTKKGPAKLYLKNIGDFDITDAASLDDGTLFVLERRFRWTEGVKMRLRRIPAGDVRPGRTLQGEILLEADLKSEIDNMEGLAVTRLTSGEVLVTMISDDNFSHLLQRTLLLQFSVNGTAHAKARP